MIEKVIYDYLNQHLTDATAYTQEPENKKPFGSSFVVMEKTGAQMNDHLYTSVIAVQSYAPSLFGAAELDEEVKTLMLALPDYASEVSGVRLIGDSNFTDTSTRQPRYQAVFDVFHY